ncbi:unnamed protein product [Natator depressus]
MEEAERTSEGESLSAVKCYKTSQKNHSQDSDRSRYHCSTLGVCLLQQFRESQQKSQMLLSPELVTALYQTLPLEEHLKELATCKHLEELSHGKYPEGLLELPAARYPKEPKGP